MASKLFNKIGVGKKQKSHIEVITQTVPVNNPPLLIRDCEEYSLPPDCEADDSVYCEPADSLNTVCASTVQPSLPALPALSSAASTKETSDSELNTSNSYSLQAQSSCTSTLQSDTSYNPDITSSCNTTPTHSNNTDFEMTVTPQMDSATNAITMETIPTDHNAALSEHTGNGHQDSFGCNFATDNSASSGLYMNNSQIQAAKTQYITNKQRPPVKNITPDIDPRNIELYPAPGNEYESPWDLESEIIEVVKQIKQPPSPLASAAPSTQGLYQKKSVGAESSPPSTSTCTVSSINHRGAEQITGLKVNYDASGVSSHKVKQPSVQRQGSSVTAGQQENTSTPTPAVSSVLVEGEWREAKQSWPLVGSPSSPELSYPRQILSQGSGNSGSSTAASKANTNTATNFIYDKSNDSEIKVMLRYSEDKSKVPCAQPRSSLSTSPLNVDDQVYENFKDAKKAAAAAVVKEYDTDAVYDDPWNVDQVQQQIFDELERKQKVVGSESRHRKASEDLPNESRKHTDKSSHKKRPTDLPSESGSYRGEDTATRRLLSASSSSATDKLHKLSPRALPGTPALPRTPASAKTVSSAPQVPQTAPGQAHANKPVLVVHKTNGTYVNISERKGSLSSSRCGSIRKNYITETTYLSTRNHTFHFSGSYSAPSTPMDVPECQHRIGLGVNKSLPLTQQPWYHGAIQRNYAEELLRRQPDGSFLIRESSNSPRDKTLSLKNSSGFIHIKIVHQPDGTVILGQFSHPFKSIMEMVEYYSRHKVNIKGAEHTYLEIPVLRDIIK